jgi:hypothetical protein
MPARRATRLLGTEIAVFEQLALLDPRIFNHESAPTVHFPAMQGMTY